MVAVEENDERDTEQEEEDEEETSFRGWIVELEGRGILGDMGACEITSLSLTHSWWWSSSSWGFFWGLHLLMQEPIVGKRGEELRKLTSVRWENVWMVNVEKSFILIIIVYYIQCGKNSSILGRREKSAKVEAFAFFSPKIWIM